MPSGGKRDGAGRPRGEETRLVRIPVSAIPDIRDFLQRRRQPALRQAPLAALHGLATAHRIDAANEAAALPLAGSRVAAGFPSPADDYIEEYLDLNRLLVHEQASTFIVRVKKESESMIEAGIYPDDLLVVDRSLTPADGDIVIAVLDGDLTVKELRLREGRVALIPRNRAMKPIVLRDGQELLVWGVVTSCIHRFRR